MVSWRCELPCVDGPDSRQRCGLGPACRAPAAPRPGADGSAMRACAPAHPNRVATPLVATDSLMLWGACASAGALATALATVTR